MDYLKFFKKMNKKCHYYDNIDSLIILNDTAIQAHSLEIAILFELHSNPRSFVQFKNMIPSIRTVIANEQLRIDTNNLIECKECHEAAQPYIVVKKEVVLVETENQQPIVVNNQEIKVEQQIEDLIKTINEPLWVPPFMNVNNNVLQLAQNVLHFYPRLYIDKYALYVYKQCCKYGQFRCVDWHGGKGYTTFVKKLYKHYDNGLYDKYSIFQVSNETFDEYSVITYKIVSPLRFDKLVNVKRFISCNKDLINELSDSCEIINNDQFSKMCANKCYADKKYLKVSGNYRTKVDIPGYLCAKHDGTILWLDGYEDELSEVQYNTMLSGKHNQICYKIDGIGKRIIGDNQQPIRLTDRRQVIAYFLSVGYIIRYALEETDKRFTYYILERA